MHTQSMVTLTEHTQPYLMHLGFPKPYLALPNPTQCLSSIIVIPVPFRISYLSHLTSLVYLGLIHICYMITVKIIHKKALVPSVRD